MSPLPFSYSDVVTKNFSAILRLRKIYRQPLTHSLDRNRHANFFGENPFVDGILGHNLLSLAFFRWESLHGWDFRPQLIAVSGLFGGDPFVDGILGHNLLLSLAFFRWESLRGWDFRPQLVVVSGLFSVGIPSWMGFFRPQLVVVSGLFLHDGTRAITKPFS
jgi:ABC-type uncharacterized transport system permease subunit